MRTDFLAATALLVMLPVASLGAQAGGGFSVTSAARARGLVGAALDAMGGLDALRRIQTVRRSLTSSRTDEGQGAKPGDSPHQYERIGTLPPEVNKSATESFRDYKGLRISEHVDYNIYGGQHVNRRQVLGATEGYNVYYDYVSKGVRPVPPANLARTKAAAFRRHPESLLQSAWGRPEGLRYLGAARWEGRPQEAVSYTDFDGSQLTLFFDARTHLLTRTESLAEDGIFGDIVAEVVYADYRRVDDVSLPFRIIDRRAGAVLDDTRVGSIELNATPSDTLFVRPAELADLDFGPAFPTVQKLGENVYAVLGGYNTVFVALKDYVVVLEAGGSVREAETVIAKIKEIAPGKPIRYVIATHWNYDHLSGIRPYVAEGTTIVGPPSVRRVVARAVSSARPLHPDALTRAPREPIFEPLGARQRTFGDGAQSVVVYDISPSPHADEMLIAYLPNEKVLFEADMLDIIVPGHVGTGGDDTADLATKIQQLGLVVDRIVPVHGQIGTMDDLRQSLARRAASAGATR